MRHRAAAAVALALVTTLFVAVAPAPASDTAEAEAEDIAAAGWIQRANQALLPADSMKARVRIVTTDDRDEWIDVLDLARASTADGATRTLLEVEAPEEGAGSAYQVVARPDGTLERWVWLSELRRLRRIVGVHRTDPFLGTEFTYEDLGLALPEERSQGSVRVVGEGPDREIELVSPPYHYYGRVVTHVDPDTALPTRVLFYDRAGQLFKEQRFEDVQQIDGRAFPTRITAHDLITGARSVLHFESVDFDADIPAERFTASIIRRKLTASEELIPEATAAGDGDG